MAMPMPMPIPMPTLSWWISIPCPCPCPCPCPFWHTILKTGWALAWACAWASCPSCLGELCSHTHPVLVDLAWNHNPPRQDGHGNGHGHGHGHGHGLSCLVDCGLVRLKKIKKFKKIRKFKKYIWSLATCQVVVAKNEKWTNLIFVEMWLEF